MSVSTLRTSFFRTGSQHMFPGVSSMSAVTRSDVRFMDLRFTPRMKPHWNSSRNTRYRKLFLLSRPWTMTADTDFSITTGKRASVSKFMISP